MRRLSSVLGGTGSRPAAGWRLVMLACAMLLAAARPGAAEDAATVETVEIPGLDIPGWGSSGTVTGYFGLPAAGAAAKLPAVLILHSSAGIDGTGNFYGKALRAAGIATLEIAMFQLHGRPSAGHKATIAYEGAALRWLGSQPSVDAGKLGVIGFSWGAVDTVLLASDVVQDRMGEDVPKPAAFAPLYPACTNLIRMVTDPHNPLYNIQTRMRAVPMLIQEGTQDDYEVGDRACDRFIAMWPAEAQQQASTRYLAGATHGFDATSPRNFRDEFAHGGQGGTIYVTPNPKAAAEARQAVVEFFTANLH